MWKLRPAAQQLPGPAEESTSTGVGVGVHVLRADKGKQGGKYIRSAALNAVGPQRLCPRSSADFVAISSGQRPVRWVGG